MWVVCGTTNLRKDPSLQAHLLCSYLLIFQDRPVSYLRRTSHVTYIPDMDRTARHTFSALLLYQMTTEFLPIRLGQ